MKLPGVPRDGRAERAGDLLVRRPRLSIRVVDSGEHPAGGPPGADIYDFPSLGVPALPWVTELPAVVRQNLLFRGLEVVPARLLPIVRVIKHVASRCALWHHTRSRASVPAAIVVKRLSGVVLHRL